MLAEGRCIDAFLAAFDQVGWIASLFLAAPWTIATEGENAEAVVQAQLEAYNAYDIHAFMATYTGDAEIYEYPASR